MSLGRTATGALKWPVRPHGPIPYAVIPDSLSSSSSSSSSPPRATILFHATRSYKRQAARSPVARDRSRIPISNGNADASGLNSTTLDPVSRLLKTQEGARAKFDISALSLYRSAKQSGIIGRMSFDTFRYIAERLIQETFDTYPTEQAVKRISKDVDAVFEVGVVMFAIDRRINAWATVATSTSGAVIPTIVTAMRHLSSVEYPMRTPALDKVEAWAKNGDPRAIVLHAKILGRREQYQEALALLENLMEKTYPTKVKPPLREDVTLDGRLDAPWELYAWLKERVGDQEATDRVLKSAALEYQDPGALVEYAHLMQLQGNMETYEECMNKAATSGHAEACRKLGNFYYLTFLGRFTPREEKSETHNTWSAKLFRFFGQSRTKDDFRKLAIDWYELAFMHGSVKAALVLSILLREDGKSEQALRYLESAEQGRKFPKNVKRLRDNWDRADFSFPVPEPLLDT